MNADCNGAMLSLLFQGTRHMIKATLFKKVAAAMF